MKKKYYNDPNQLSFLFTEEEVKGKPQSLRIFYYHKLKEKYDKVILLFKNGCFYEAYEKDAVTLAPVLKINYTQRGGNTVKKYTMAGFPESSLDEYLQKIIGAGYRVAIVNNTIKDKD